MAEIIAPFGPSRHAPAPDADVIAVLESLLERARKGEIAALAYAFTTPNDTVHSGWQGIGSANVMLGAISALQIRYAHVWLETCSTAAG